MEKERKLKALVGLSFTPVAFGLPLFLCAGTLNYWEAWVFILVFSAASALHSIYLMEHDPALLERRMRVGPTMEKRPAQRIIVVLVIICFFMLLIVSAIDHRMNWSHLAVLAVLAGDCAVALSFLIFHVVCRANSFAAATIDIFEGQRVISTGPYSFVRHPMYSGALLLSVGMPIALGSWWGVLVAIVMLPALIWRIVDEEKFLSESLAGYTDYCKKVKYRLVPGIY